MIQVTIKKNNTITHQAKFESQVEVDNYLTDNSFENDSVIEIEDITAQFQAEQESIEALEYLKDTDWYIIREMDTGTPCPQEIKTTRAAARLKVL